MLTLGIAGGLDPVHEERFDSPENYTYDGAAVLVEDGQVVAAIEEERLNRIRHSNKFPVQAIRFCLEQRGIRLQDVDRIAYYVHEEAANGLLARLQLASPSLTLRADARALMAGVLGREFGAVDPARLRFVQHKLTHAVSAVAHSGFAESLVMIIDNAGGVFLGRAADTGGVTLESLTALPPAKSLGRLAQAVLPFLGLGLFDEYKAMALAPYGDPAVFAPVFAQLHELRPDGDYVLHLDRVALLMGKVAPRRSHQEFSPAHRDLAAALQRCMEDIVLHVLRHYQAVTGQRRLCLAGGMAENVSTNGRVLYSGLFDQVFVHPAAYDSGCALGAALLAAQEAPVPGRTGLVRHVSWGTDVGASASIEAELERWRGFLSFEKHTDVAAAAAPLLARGALVGWVQGRSEFGSHALGHRSVLADPRPVEHRARLSKALGRGEEYRPPGLSLLEEDLREFIDAPPGLEAAPFMALALKVREDKQALVAAGTHVDGTARVQTVSRDVNPRLWALLAAFKGLTGVPALVQASFNNGTEPTVDSVEDAVVSLLTTGVEHLVVGDFIVGKRTPSEEDWLALEVSLPPYVKVLHSRGFVERQQKAAVFELATSYDSRLRRRLSEGLGAALLRLDGALSVRALLAEQGSGAERRGALLAELKELWTQRLVVLRAHAGQERGS
ncbi:nodulation protein [Corallococcus sp. CA053C]|uniref:carbamoyltransferase C-terminal domain-containing protein n=1 Tax=Corallococcus sp. CA053C TaxID=2316732 RepID=UPI000EA3F381|nr:carbamoyltransferase C-terminal domain-containing protein [Corallococcus sp. CA053C]RKH00249.1 nodulation protein [Corallococcus sp. CA053C]